MIRALRFGSQVAHVQRRCFHSTRRHWQVDKLRVLFCGSDNFSVKHLEALHQFKESGESNIDSIDVVTRTDKLVGRGLKSVRSPPIKDYALSYKLPLHQIDTFNGWTPPDINLIIAVSFGLLIPSRIIRSSKYGGLNVHPSLLPDLRGAAPIQWSIVHERKHVGVSVQSLHETKFDHGVVLAQSGKIPMPEKPSPHRLKELLQVIGAEMLVKAVRNRLYLLPYQPIVAEPAPNIFAPKIKTEHKAVNFSTMGSDEIMRRHIAFGPVHAFVEADGKKRRLKLNMCPFPSKAPASVTSVITHDLGCPFGVPFTRVKTGEEPNKLPHLWVNTIDGKGLIILEMLVEGGRKRPAAFAATSAHLFDDGTPAGTHTLYQFKAPLTAT